MLRRAAFAIVFLALAAPGFATTPEQNVALVEAMIKAVNQREFERLDALVAPDMVRHCAATPGVEVTSLQQFKDFIAADLAACPDAKQTVNLIFGGDDKVAVHVTYTGTQTGVMGSFPATGKRMEIPFLGILRIEEGLIAEIWVEWDNLGALVQLGHIPARVEANPEAR